MPQDIDLVIKGVEPDILEHWLLQRGAAEFVGHFGTFKFIPHGCGGMQPIDIALPRTEHVFSENHLSGRRDLRIDFNYLLAIEEDLARRDFTINAMAMELRRGRLIDPFLGLQDLNAGIINCVLSPTDRFHEDATRILRGLRFASQLGFGIERQTWEAMKQNVNLLNNVVMQENGLHAFVVAREMIGREFLLGFTAHPIHTVRLWSESRALHLFMPNLAKLEKMVDESNKPLLERTYHLLDAVCAPHLLASYSVVSPSPTLLLSALMMNLEGDKAKHAFNICKELHFHQFGKNHPSKIECSDLFWILQHSDYFETVDPASMSPSQFEKLFLNERGRDLFILMHASMIVSGRHSVARERLHVARRICLKMKELGEIEGTNGRLPRLINGKDIEKTGIKPGPKYREIIDKIRDAQWTGKITNKQEALGYLSSIV
ncbi:hypothetical protein KJ766_03000 [Patescibacteria group bacterium]|nr:hypothetical protein [Patescibacteria group bacterium]